MRGVRRQAQLLKSPATAALERKGVQPLDADARRRAAASNKERDLEGMTLGAPAAWPVPHSRDDHTRDIRAVRGSGRSSAASMSQRTRASWRDCCDEQPS
jgi:hypothetical protein